MITLSGFYFRSFNLLFAIKGCNLTICLIISGESKFRHSCFDARVLRFHQVRRFRSSSTSTLVFYQRSVSTILRSTFVFHRRSSSIDVRLPSTFVFHRRSSSIDVRFRRFFVRRSSSIDVRRFWPSFDVHLTTILRSTRLRFCFCGLV